MNIALRTALIAGLVFAVQFPAAAATKHKHHAKAHTQTSAHHTSAHHASAHGGKHASHPHKTAHHKKAPAGKHPHKQV